MTNLLASLPTAGGDLRILGLQPEDCPTMQWLMRFWVLSRIHKFYHGFHPAAWHLRCQSLSGGGAPRWNDYTVPKEFNFASNVLGYWTQMEKVRRHPYWRGHTNSFILFHSVFINSVQLTHGNFLTCPKQASR